MKRVIVCGSRGWTDDLRIGAELARVYGELGPFKVIQGGARGADQMAADLHSRTPWGVEEFLPDWRPFGVYNPQAGKLRNTEMLAAGADLVLAFWDGQSTGTKDMIDKARAAGVPVRIIPMEESW